MIPSFRWSARGFVAVALAVLVGNPAVRSAPQLLPGVYGYGADRAVNTAGFGPTSTIIEVTNLSDGTSPVPAGSLRAALVASGPRIIVFKTSGVINLVSAINVNNGNVTIAGQTAPSPGIAIHGAGLTFTASNVLVQHIRIRPGDAWNGVSISNRDALSFANSATAISNAVFDHCTFAWTLDEVASTWYGWDNVTFNKCIFAEAMHVSIHLDEGTFSPNVPQVAEIVTNTKSTSFTTGNVTSSVAIGGQYQSVNFTGDTQWIEYNLPIVSGSARGLCHLVVVGVKGPDRAKFKVEIRDANNILLNTTGATEIFDQYAASEAQQTAITQQNMTYSFNIPASQSVLKARLIVSGRNAANTTGWKLGIDQLSISQGHGFGPLSSNGGSSGGKWSFTGSIFAHLAGRMPWSNAKQFYFGNNILYNRSWEGLQLGHSNWQTAADQIHAAILGNTFIEGRDISGSASLPSPVDNTAVPAGSQIYVGAASDNAYNFGDRANHPAMIDTGLSSFLVGTDPSAKTAGLSGVTAMTPATAYDAALMTAGARPSDRDPHELRLIQEIADGTAKTALATRDGSIKHTVASAGGFPTYAVNIPTWNPPIPSQATANDVMPSGYTRIEEWLQGQAAALEAGPLDPPTPKFDNFQDGDASGWLPDGGTWGVTTAANGSLVYQQSDNTQSAVRTVLTGTNWTDQLVEADVNATSFNGANVFFGVVARYKDPTNYYYLVLRSNNTWELKRLLNNVSFTIASGATTVTTGTWKTLSLEVIGTSLKGYLNGVLLGSGTDSSHTSGRTALLTYLTSAQFDNVVADPNPGAVNAPAALTATVAGSPNNINTINLAWSNVANETGYKVERKKGASGTWSQIGTTAADVVTFGDNTCGSGTQYFYRVRATNAGGDSVYSPEANATTAEVSSGRQAHWKFDENAGTTTADASGNGNTGTLTNGPTWVAGKIGSALNFDVVDDVVAAGSGASLDDLPAITITAWIKPNSIGEAGNPGRIVHKGTGTSPTNGWQFVTQANNTIAFAADHGATDLNRVSANNAISLSAWQHVAVTWTGSATATNVKFYVNGVETAYGTTTDGGAARVSDAASSVFIGNDNSGARTFDGALDDVRIYNRVISTTELQAIYRAGL